MTAMMAVKIQLEHYAKMKKLVMNYSKVNEV